MAKKFLNSVFPISAEIGKLYNKETVEEVRAELKQSGNHIINGSDLIPGAVEIPLEKMIDAGFSVRFFLKDNTESVVDKFNSGIIIASIQHNDVTSASVIDGFSFNFDPRSEVEISTLTSAIVYDTVPGAFGGDYDINKLFASSSDKIRDLIQEAELNRKIREEKVRIYEANPKLAQKHTKKALDKLKFKHNELLHLKSKDLNAVKAFQLQAVTIIGEIFGMNGLKSFEDLKRIPEIKAELDKGGNLAEVIERISEVVAVKNKSNETLIEDKSTLSKEV